LVTKKTAWAYLGLDIGTTSVKAVIVDQSGTVLGEGDGPQGISVPRPGWSEQSPLDWWQGAVAATRQAVSQAPAGTEVAAIGLSGQMHSAVFLDAGDHVIRPAILWNDVRTTAQCQQIIEKVGLPGLRRYTGNPALEGFTATKLLWLRDNEPDSYHRLRTLMLAKDYVRLRMTGEKATDPSDAAATLLFDVLGSRWSAEMLSALEVNPGILPPVVPSWAPAGTLQMGAASELGLKPGTPVAGGGADNACAALGAGVVGEGSLLVSLGTSGTVVAPVTKPKADAGMRIHLMNHAAPDTWYLMGVVLSAGAALAWLRRVLGSAGPGAGVLEYGTLIAEAATVPPGADGLTFLPYLTGERTPHADANARGVFCWIFAGHTRGHLVRAVLEGVAFAFRDSLELERKLGVNSAEAIIVGGGARSPVWRQVLADVLETTMVTAATSGAPVGAAMLGVTASGDFASVSEAAGAWARPAGRTEPGPRTFEAYRAAYARYRSLYRRLKPQFEDAAHSG